jgi:hypothetical protein
VEFPRAGSDVGGYTYFSETQGSNCLFEDVAKNITVTYRGEAELDLTRFYDLPSNLWNKSWTINGMSYKTTFKTVTL